MHRDGEVRRAPFRRLPWGAVVSVGDPVADLGRPVAEVALAVAELSRRGGVRLAGAVDIIGAAGLNVGPGGHPDGHRRATFAGRTSFVIARRLSTILAANVILVLQEGRPVDRGMCHELLQRGGMYRTLHEHQLDLEARPLVAAAAGE